MKNYLTFNHIAPLIISLFLSIFIFKISHGLLLILTFIPAIVIALIFYYIITDTKNSNSLFKDSILITYLTGIAMHFIQFIEEYTGGFIQELAVNGTFIHRLTREIYNTPSYTQNNFVIFYMVTYSILIIALIGFVRKEKASIFFLSLFIMVGLVGNGIEHIVYAVIVKGYFPGLFFSVVEFIVGIILIMQFISFKRNLI